MSPHSSEDQPEKQSQASSSRPFKIGPFPASAVAVLAIFGVWMWLKASTNEAADPVNRTIVPAPDTTPNFTPEVYTFYLTSETKSDQTIGWITATQANGGKEQLTYTLDGKLQQHLKVDQSQSRGAQLVVKDAVALRAELQKETLSGNAIVSSSNAEPRRRKSAYASLRIRLEEDPPDVASQILNHMNNWQTNASTRNRNSYHVANNIVTYNAKGLLANIGSYVPTDIPEIHGLPDFNAAGTAAPLVNILLKASIGVEKNDVDTFRKKVTGALVDDCAKTAADILNESSREWHHWTAQKAVIDAATPENQVERAERYRLYLVELMERRKLVDGRPPGHEELKAQLGIRRP